MTDTPDAPPSEPEDASAPPTEAGETTTKRKLSPVDKLIVVLCVVGVVMAIVLALDYSGISLFDGHAAEVLSEAWNSDATIGLIVAFVVSAGVGVFIWLLARATVSNPADDLIEEEFTPEMIAE